MAFPNTYFADLNPKGQFDNLQSVTKEVKLMMDPNADPYAAATEIDPNAAPEKFGASDIFDLNQVQLLNAYTCTECGRCTAVCPANITGKKLSPRKIMMDTRDRLEEVGKNIHRVPTFIFLHGNKEIGRIVESPVVSLEKDMIAILEKKSYSQITKESDF